MPTGRIVKALSGYYYVQPDDETQEEWITCRARGLFKKKGLSPLVGDQVTYELSNETEGTVTEIKLPRKSELVRPPMANAEVAVLVFSVTEPSLNLQLLDKFLVHIESAGLDALICLTKSDLANEEEQACYEQAEQLYRQIGYDVYVTSSKEGTGVAAIHQALEGKIGVFAGQSGVGKSSLLNCLLPGLNLETNAISQKLGRGKHTTRHVELIPLPGQAWMADTPGFSQLDFMQVEAEELSGCFPEFRALAASCKFRGCQHNGEPKCQVMNAVEQGEVSRSRYDHYLYFLQEIKDKKRRY
ncbi:ribosome small subunit-dependent GTPase A [Marinicrinis sediminis]|uniref:Small ribosomal subunit biogenesis GTPase RsgA n=1 Tax=Marinicrinis sediminis TaxID=1652465 RepID=A0ABW5R587_9BACL